MKKERKKERKKCAILLPLSPSFSLRTRNGIQQNNRTAAASLVRFAVLEVGGLVLGQLHHRAPHLRDPVGQDQEDRGDDGRGHLNRQRHTRLSLAGHRPLLQPDQVPHTLSGGRLREGLLPPQSAALLRARQRPAA